MKPSPHTLSATYLNALKSQIRFTNFISIVCKFHLLGRQGGEGKSSSSSSRRRLGAAGAAGHHHNEHPANVSNSAKLPYLSTLNHFSWHPPPPSHPAMCSFSQFSISNFKLLLLFFALERIPKFWKTQKSLSIACRLPLFHMGHRSRGLHRIMTQKSGNAFNVRWLPPAQYLGGGWWLRGLWDRAAVCRAWGGGD